MASNTKHELRRSGVEDTGSEEERKRKAREKYRRFVENLSDNRKEERKRRRREASRRLKARKVNIGSQKVRWDAMKSVLGMRTDRDMAQLLLSTYLHTVPTENPTSGVNSVGKQRASPEPSRGRGRKLSREHGAVAAHQGSLETRSLRRKRGRDTDSAQDQSSPLKVMQLTPALNSETMEDFSISVMQLVPKNEAAAIFRDQDSMDQLPLVESVGKKDSKPPRESDVNSSEHSGTKQNQSVCLLRTEETAVSSEIAGHDSSATKMEDLVLSVQLSSSSSGCACDSAAGAGLTDGACRRRDVDRGLVTVKQEPVGDCQNL